MSISTSGYQAGAWEHCRFDHHQRTQFPQKMRQASEIPTCVRRARAIVVHWQEGTYQRLKHQGNSCRRCDDRRCCRWHGASGPCAWRRDMGAGRPGLSRPARSHPQRSASCQDLTNRRCRHSGVVDEVEKAKNRTKSRAGQRGASISWSSNAHQLSVTCALANLFMLRCRRAWRRWESCVQNAPHSQLRPPDLRIHPFWSLLRFLQLDRISRHRQVVRTVPKTSIV
jgi:hypothetical protein